MSDLQPPTQAAKKHSVVFSWEGRDNGAWQRRTRRVNFGQAGADDFTTHGDERRRARYRQRHAGDLERRLPGDLVYTQPGWLSWHILWGEHKNLRQAVAAYKQKWR